MEPSDTTMKPLLATLADLWPDSDGGTVERSRRSPATAVPAAAGFWVVPHARAPRILIPAGNARAGAAAIRRYSAAISLQETVQRLALASALSAGAASALLPDRVQLGAVGEHSIVSYLENVFGQAVTVSLSIGPARANRKPVLQVFDARGRSLAFVKVGDTATATAHVTREANTLTVLAGQSFSTLELPSLISFGSWNSMSVLVMSALNTGPAARGLRLARLRERALAELNEVFAQPDAPLAQTSLWRTLHENQAELADDRIRSRFGECLDRVERQLPDQALRVGAWHGDFTPWNMARRGGRLQLWDWERFEQGVPVGLDRVHYPLNRHLRKAGTTVNTILGGLELGAPGFRDSSSADAVVVAAYLASISLRYLLGAQGEGGETLSAKSRLMLAALEQVTAQGERATHVR